MPSSASSRAAARGRLEIAEKDEAGNAIASYIESKPERAREDRRNADNGKGSRIDIALPQKTKSHGQQLLDVFLPAGYPQSVTDDYIQYQIYDSLQAFSSSIASMLSSRAVLEGVGVGDASASPTTALLLSVLQESMGRIATIFFAHRLGTSLEPECKMYRFTADVFNDTSMVLDCLSPAFPKVIRMLVLSFSSVLRSLCGVCAGSSKASLSAHFAKRGNLGELNAKDSSQETVISLMGMLAGSFVVSCVSTPTATWTTLVALLSVHLATNYIAVKSVSMRCLNRQRANIVLSNMMGYGKVLRPTEVSSRERIFERDGVLRWANDRIIGYCKIGVTIQTLLSHIGGSTQYKQTGSLQLQAIELSDLTDLYGDEKYFLWFAQSEAFIVLKQDSSPIDQLKAWAHALVLAQRAQKHAEHPQPQNDTSRPRDQLAELRLTLEETRKAFDTYGEALRDSGWNLDVAALETRAGTRAIIIENEKRT